MKGLALSKAYYEAVGRPMIEQHFAAYRDRIAVGLVGHGSECFGYDDDVSLDHDFEPGFCLWLTDEDYNEFGFELFKAYRRLPNEFMGTKINARSAFGGDFKGVQTVREFYSYYTGSGDVPASNSQWLAIEPFFLAEATNGEVFYDPVGEFSRIREGLLQQVPEDVWKARIASSLFYMAQYGQYNYKRCLSHGEKAAAALALVEFSRHTACAAYAISRRHAPYYKWLFRGLAALPGFPDLSARIEQLCAAPYDEAQNSAIIEQIAARFVAVLRESGLSPASDPYLEAHAYAVHNQIRDNELRNSSVIL